MRSRSAREPEEEWLLGRVLRVSRSSWSSRSRPSSGVADARSGGSLSVGAESTSSEGSCVLISGGRRGTPCRRGRGRRSRTRRAARIHAVELLPADRADLATGREADDCDRPRAARTSRISGAGRASIAGRVQGKEGGVDRRCNLLRLAPGRDAEDVSVSQEEERIRLAAPRCSRWGHPVRSEEITYWSCVFGYLRTMVPSLA
jgi:hypothetical protein